MQHMKRSSLPIIWNQETYVNDGKGELWENRAQFGYRCGIALAIHLPAGRHFAIGLDSDRPLPTSTRKITALVADLQLFAVHAQEAGFRIFDKSLDWSSTHSLTPREIEALRLTMGGRTAFEVGEALNISKRTAVFHLQNAVKKLGCINKHQAVLKALRLRLLA